MGVLGMWACVETFNAASCPNPDFDHWVNGNPDPCYAAEPRPDAGSQSGDAGDDVADAASGVVADAGTDAGTASDAGGH
jgi:hypothetical protein